MQSTLQINIFVVLLVLELLMVLLGLSVFLFLRGVHHKKRAEAAPPHDIHKEEEWSYEAWLRDELVQSNGRVDEAKEAVGDKKAAADDPVVRALLMRHRFLQAELNTHVAISDPKAYREKLREEMEGLLGDYGAAPETEVQTVTVSAQTEEEEGEAESADKPVKEIDRSEEELDRLKQVIAHQHEVMRDLRASLEEHTDDPDALADILAKLDAAERQSNELNRCVEVLEQENQRLLAAAKRPRGEIEVSGEADTGVRRAAEPSEDLSQLRSLVTDQQDTIGNLKKALQDLVPEKDKAEQLEAMIDKMNRANRELNGCLMVLEDENEMLRTRIRELEQPEGAEGAEAAEGGEGQVPADALAEEERAALEQRIHDLETQLEFRDLTIQQLQGTGDDGGTEGAPDLDAAAKEQLQQQISDLEVQLEFRDLTIQQLRDQNEAMEKELAELKGEGEAGGGASG